jgi:hypothetical protein
MFIQSSLQKIIPNSNVIISIRTFKRFGEYVKNYGHEPKYDQGGLFMFYIKIKSKFYFSKVIFHEHLI